MQFASALGALPTNASALQKHFKATTALSLKRNGLKNKVGQRTDKQDGAHHTFCRKSCGVGSNAVHETDARSVLRHRATIHHSMLRQLRLDFSNNYFCKCHVIPFHLSNRY